MSQVTKRGAVEPSLNITPLIDVVFLLIVFFMLVNNIVTDEVPKVQLPDLDKPNVFPPEGDRRVIVNIVPEAEFDGEFGPGNKRGEVLSRPGQAEFVQIGGRKWKLGEEDAMEDFRTNLEAMIKARMVNPNTPPNIMLRVDAAVYYAQVLPVMTNLQLAMAEALGGELAAATPVHLVAYQGKDKR
ncbi:MAG: ExbD/TolR family protein [Phycisphaeraceae bacterium]|jgi:biopolymer transport protein ExbD